MNPTSRILIVDQSRDSREVLRAVLEQRGLRIFEAADADEGVQKARECEPDLIVLDLEAVPPGPSGSEELSAEARDRHTPLVVLGGMRRRRPSWDGEEFVSKPFAYKPLILKIEQLLASRREAG